MDRVESLNVSARDQLPLPDFTYSLGAWAKKRFVRRKLLLPRHQRLIGRRVWIARQAELVGAMTSEVAGLSLLYAEADKNTLHGLEVNGLGPGQPSGG